MTPGPSPISWEPSGQWVGNDGNWSSFAVQAGTPLRTFEVLPSTAGTSTWLIDPIACHPGPKVADDCIHARGGVFNSNNSKTWVGEGIFGLNLESNLGKRFVGGASYGFDTLMLGSRNSTEKSATLQSQVLATINTKAYYNGLFGLNDQPTHFTYLNDTHPSFLSTLKSRNLIPSLSWGYTAGASYRQSPGSLTFGGYDLSRIEPNNIDFSMASDVSRDLLVGLRSITSKASNGTSLKLLSDPILAFIDSSISPMYLPQEVCQAFADTFGLIWDSDFSLYLVDEDAHRNMTAKNPSITLTIGDTLTGGPTLDIVLPYASFHLDATFPRVPETMQYFPLQRGNSSQYTLGRVFLQEAYIATNYERQNFSVSKAKFDASAKSNIIRLPPAAATPMPPAVPSNHAIPKDASSGLSLGAKIGISIGLTVALVMILLAVGLVIWVWRRKSRKCRDDGAKSVGLTKSQSVFIFEKQELDGHGTRPEPSYWIDEKRIDPMNLEVVELPIESEVHEMMAPPQRLRNPRGRRKRGARSYAAYINVKKARENRMSNGKISPPISKFCNLFCMPIHNRIMDLNRPLPPTPLATPRASRNSSPMPKNRFMSHR